MSEWVIDVIERLGALGVGVLIFLENVVPPIPSEVILPFAGFTAQQGDLNAVAAWLAATLGALAGALMLYGIGALVGEDRLRELSRKRWFIFFGEKDFDRGDRFFDRHGAAVVFFGRFIPLVRSIVSVPAGIERMPIPLFALLTFVGSGIWNAVFITAGWVLGENWDRVENLLAPISYVVLLLLAAAGGFLLYRKLRSTDEVPA